jgi:hypothetical protein
VALSLAIFADRFPELTETFVSGEARVWLRSDRAEGIADASPKPVDFSEVQAADDAAPSP